MVVSNQSKLVCTFILPDQSLHTTVTYSNTVDTFITTDVVTCVKYSDRTRIDAGQSAQQTVVITNYYHLQRYQVFFCDQLTGGAYVAGSVCINGVAQPNADLKIGFKLPALSLDQSVTITYAIQANYMQTKMTNTAAVTYTTVDPSGKPITQTIHSNQVCIAIKAAAISVQKRVSQTIARCGDCFTYTVIITNTTDKIQANLRFYDRLPKGIDFIPASVQIDRKSYSTLDPTVGFVISKLNQHASTTITFQVALAMCMQYPSVCNVAHVTVLSTINSKTYHSNVVVTKINRCTQINPTPCKSNHCIAARLYCTFQLLCHKQRRIDKQKQRGTIS